MAEKVGRNDPCPCGSGLKYKKCCLPKDRQREKLEEEAENKELMEAYEEVEEIEEVADEDAIRFYTSEFVQNGYSITRELLHLFFEKCIALDGYIDSRRVKEFCDYLRKERRIAVTIDYIIEYFEEVKYREQLPSNV